MGFKWKHLILPSLVLFLPLSWSHWGRQEAHELWNDLQPAAGCKKLCLTSLVTAVLQAEWQLEFRGQAANQYIMPSSFPTLPDTHTHTHARWWMWDCVCVGETELEFPAWIEHLRQVRWGALSPLGFLYFVLLQRRENSSMKVWDILENTCMYLKICCTIGVNNIIHDMHNNTLLIKLHYIRFYKKVPRQWYFL